MSEFHSEVPQAISSEGLAQGPYVTARAGFEPATLRTKGDESTNDPPLPYFVYLAYHKSLCYEVKIASQYLCGTLL